MRKYIEDLLIGADQSELDLYLGIIESVEGLTKDFNRDFFKECEKGNRDYHELSNALAENGLMGLGVPESQGGVGGGLFGAALLLDMLGQAGLASMKLFLTTFCRSPIIKHGTEEQIKKYVTPSTQGEKSFCIMATEPDAGTNTFKIKTKAEKVGDKWILNGQKTFITCAHEADYGLVIAKTDTDSSTSDDRKEGITVFVMDMKAAGVDMHKLNIQMSKEDTQWTVFMDNVELDEDAVIGKVGRGLQAMFDALNPERLLISSMVVGMSDYVANKTVDYVNQRAPFGQPTGSYQGVQHPLAKAKIHTDAARLAIYQGARLYDQGKDAGTYANMAKYMASTAGCDMCDAAIQFHGGSGMDEDTDILYFWRVARTTRIAPINNEMVLNFVAEHNLGMPKSY